MRKLFSLVAAVSVLTLAASSAQAQNLLANGTLDSTAVSSQVLATPTNWDVIATGAIIGAFNDGASSEEFAGNPPTPDTGVGPADKGLFYKAFTGTAARGPMTVHLQQDNAAIVGQRYQLNGWAGAEANFLAAGAEMAIEFLDGGLSVIGGTTLNLVPTLFVANGQPFNYKNYFLSSVAPAGTIGVRARVSMLGGTPNPAGGGQAFVVDDFELKAIAEPTSLGLAGLGLAALAVVRRRRQA